MNTCPSRSDVFVYTVISQEYMELGAMWGAQVQKVSGVSPHYVCSDAESFEFLQKKGFPCSIYEFDEVKFLRGRSKFGEIHFPSLKAVYTVSLKLDVALDHLQRGKSVLYSDVDAIWMKDPMTKIFQSDAEFIFQPGSFPEEIKREWGFAVCTGFFFMESTPKVIAFAKKVRKHFDGDDQRTLNKVLFEDLDIYWESRPQNWETTILQNGWTKSIPGICNRTGLSALALPHSYYQRHNTHKETCAHAIICHPNSPKDQQEKYKVFADLGFKLPGFDHSVPTKKSSINNDNRFLISFHKILKLLKPR